MSEDKTFDDYFNEAIAGTEPTASELEEMGDGNSQSAQVSSDDQTAEQTQSTPAETSTAKIPAPQDTPSQADQSDSKADYKSLYLAELQKSKSWDGRIRKANERAEAAERLLSEANSRIANMENQQKDKTSKVLPDGSADEGDTLASFYDEFPDLKRPLELMIKKEAAQILEQKYGHIQSTVDTLKEDSAQSAKERHYKAITEAHSDWRELVSSGKLNEWIGTQPSYVQESLDRVKVKGNAQEVIEMFDSFKQSPIYKPKPKQESKQSAPNQNKIKSLMAVEGSSGGPPKAKPAADDFDAAWKEANAK